MTLMLKLPSGHEVLVDDEDHAALAATKWFAQPAHNTVYAVRRCTVNGVHKKIYMHRQILGCLGGHVDHINGNGLDNRRSNIRHVSVSDNLRNRGVTRFNTSGYKGVSFKKDTGKWGAWLRIDGKSTALGSFDTAEEASAAYQAKFISLYGTSHVRSMGAA